MLRVFCCQLSLRDDVTTFAYQIVVDQQLDLFSGAGCHSRSLRFQGSSQCKVSSVTLMRRLSSNSRKNQIYKAFRESGA
ncbi:hypothetical protein ACWCRF_31015 [Streptomyces sp. NPDC002405]|uniref:hypothetical protein n=1 Tax=unclassified Streptomyces TaxID=2593676 RepID=UPI0036896507